MTKCTLFPPCCDRTTKCAVPGNCALISNLRFLCSFITTAVLWQLLDISLHRNYKSRCKDTPYAPQTCPVMPCHKKIAVFVPKTYFLFARTGKKQYLCAVENTTAFIDACLGILESGRFRANQTRIDRCFRGMYSLCPLGTHTYPRGLLSFILVAGSCRNLKIVNKQG